MDGIKVQTVGPTALDGWAITRIPPETTTFSWSTGRKVNLVGVSDVILEEDFVGYARQDPSDSWILSLKQ
ncbi:MAG: hypothetical protein NT131_00705 [Methanomassiliicoccales archaeon]|nr:hypothetical protein [Methanomassiliicoccales archaeon]